MGHLEGGEDESWVTTPPHPVDGGRSIDRGKTSHDYSIFRPGPPESFYEKLLALGVGLKRQRILDLGTGTGVLARQFSKQGAVVTGIDISGEQIQAAKILAEAEALEVDFRVARAESTPFPDGSFEVITANQCWLYFDKKRTIPEVERLLSHVHVQEVMSRSVGLPPRRLEGASRAIWPERRRA